MMRSVPAGLSSVVQVSAGTYYSLALKSDGTVVAWGYNESGRTSVPAGLSGVVQVAAGGGHSLALRSDGTVVSWGSNTTFQQDIPAGLSEVGYLAAGYYHSAAIKPALAPVLGDTSPADGIYGALYIHTLVASGTAPITFHVIAGSLPPGLSLNSTTGEISGTPTQAGSFTGIMLVASNTAGGTTQAMSITIAPASLNVTADNKSRMVGEANPALTYQASGFVNGDTAAVLRGSLTTSATMSSPADNYPIAQGNLAATNYQITFTPGTLTIVSASQSRVRIYLPLIIRPR